ncbi:MAG: DUF3040 domain-containing protein [Actinomycetaceae bacterium]|nr:DUF3040 domain-containing protein [Actinomycetaceae bacterium]
MPLSDEERAILEQMEQELRREDPRFASTMASSQRQRATSAPTLRQRRSPRRIAVGGTALVVGQIVMLMGISLPQLWMTILVGIAGFGLMLGGVLYALSRSETAVYEDEIPPAGRTESFMERQERLWNDRQR